MASFTTQDGLPFASAAIRACGSNPMSSCTPAIGSPCVLNTALSTTVAPGCPLTAARVTAGPLVSGGVLTVGVSVGRGCCTSPGDGATRAFCTLPAPDPRQAAHHNAN